MKKTSFLPVSSCFSRLWLGCAIALACVSASAEERVFIGGAVPGGGGNSLWSDSAQWEGGLVPQEGDALFFRGNPSNRKANSNDLTEGLRVTGIHFRDGTQPYGLAGNGLELAGNISSNTTFAGFQEIHLSLKLASGTWTVDTQSGVAGAGIEILGDITGEGGLIKTGAGLLSMRGTKTFTGGVTLQEGILRPRNSAQSLGSGPLVITGGMLVLSHSPLTVSSLSGTGGVISGDGSTSNRVLTVQSSGQDVFEGTFIRGDSTTALIALAKEGVGTLTLTNTNTYNGATTVSAGTLGLTSTGAITVSAVTVAANARFASAGGEVGGSLSLGHNSALSLASTVGEQTALTVGQLMLTGSVDLQLTLGDGFAVNQTITLIEVTDARIGTFMRINGAAFEDDDTFSLGMYRMQLLYDGPSGDVNARVLEVIPEPGSVLLLTLGAGLAVYRWRRGRNRAGA